MATIAPSEVGFTREALRLDAPREADRIAAWIRRTVYERLRRRGAVVALSGGVDSSLVAALCVRALGSTRVVGLLMPERESSEETRRLGRAMAEHVRIEAIEHDITSMLQAAGCYGTRDAAIRSVVPDYGEGWRCKVVLPGLVESDRLRVFSVVVRSPDGRELRRRLTASAYLGVVASTSFKQRTRKMLEYYHADRLAYAVVGTPNRLEHDLGFFVKNGDGAADLEPIAHLYKSQVFQLAEHLGVPESIRLRAPTTDTYSLPQSQDEFYFALPLEHMDLCLHAHRLGVPARTLGAELGLGAEQVERVYRDIEAKSKASRYLHTNGLTLDAGGDA
jgi:NAD+ synthase